MKIYVVTRGCYSNYEICRVFLNKDKAEKYAKWLEDSNPIEEYETSDDSILFDSDELDNKVVVGASIIWPDDKIKIYQYNDDYHLRNNSEFRNYRKTQNGFNLYTIIKFTNKDFSEDRIKKYLYDMKAYILSLQAEGYNERQINEMINKED